MKRLVLLPILALLFYSFYPFHKKKLKAPDEFVNIPPGNYYIEEGGPLISIAPGSLYMSKYEVTNRQYRVFLFETMRQYPKAQMTELIYDSAGWTRINKEAFPMSQYYHSHLTYNEYPVVNISHNAAKRYCTWLQEKIQSDNPDYKIEVRLPTKQEWVASAMGGRSQAMFPWANYYLQNKKGEYLCNFKKIPDNAIFTNPETGKPVIYENNNSNTILYTSKVDSYYKNDFGLYNMCGNVAEMIQEEGIAMGGSWNDYGGEIHIMAQKKYTGANATVGFRPVIVISQK